MKALAFDLVTATVAGFDGGGVPAQNVCLSAKTGCGGPAVKTALLTELGNPG
jgi:hypothetical protein